LAAKIPSDWTRQSFDARRRAVNIALQRCIAVEFSPLHFQTRTRRDKTEGSCLMSKQYRIAVIPGDGIGKEVMPEGLRVIEAAAKKHGVRSEEHTSELQSLAYLVCRLL